MDFDDEVITCEERLAEQAVFVPPPEPSQPQVHGPEPENDAIVPLEHRLELPDVSDESDCPFAEPQTPFFGVTLSEALHN